METTTIMVKRNTKKKLDELKTNPRESIDSVIERLMDMAIDDEPLSKEEINGIRKGLKDIENGRTHSDKDVYKKLGI
jgi:predicted transcriptional regulator